MGSLVPHFKYWGKDPANRHFGFIELDNGEKYWIANLEDLYNALGFYDEMRKSGVLPDNYLSDKYTKDPTAKNSALYQILILKYLIKYFPLFKERYLLQYQGWINSYESEFGSSSIRN